MTAEGRGRSRVLKDSEATLRQVESALAELGLKGPHQGVLEVPSALRTSATLEDRKGGDHLVVGRDFPLMGTPDSSVEDRLGASARIRSEIREALQHLVSLLRTHGTAARQSGQAGRDVHEIGASALDADSRHVVADEAFE